MLDTLVKCTNVAEFEQMLQAFLNLGSKEQETDSLTPKELEQLEKFMKYFAKTYAIRAHQWAYCYRSNVGLTTNNHIESMHKSLKYSYFAGKVNQRLDRLLLVLFSFKADKLFSRAIALVKGKGDHRKTALFKKYKAGLEILPSNIVKVRHGQWKVESQSKTGSHYTVERTEVICTGCELHYKQCEACHHMCACTCLDHVMHAHMCKHTHAVVSVELQSRKSQQNSASCVAFPQSSEGESCPMIDDHSCLMKSAQIIIQGTKQHSSEKSRAKKLESFKVQAEATFQGLSKKLLQLHQKS